MLFSLTPEHVYLGDMDFSIIYLPQWMTSIYAMIAGVIFPPLNAPVEELQYRGYAQSRLIAATRSVWIGIILPALGFGLQHIAFGFTLYAGIMYSAGFFLWGSRLDFQQFFSYHFFLERWGFRLISAGGQLQLILRLRKVTVV